MLRKFLRQANPEIVFGFLAATVFWIGILGWQAAYSPSEIERRQCEDTAQHSGHKTEECKTLWERTTSDPVAFFTFWLVVSTVGLAVSTIMLWRAGEKQFRLARRISAMQSRDMKASILEAKRSADAANRSAKIAEDSIVKLQRASVFMADINFNWHPDTAREGKFWWHFRPVLQNAGNTQTREMTTNVCFEFRDTPLPKDFSFPVNKDSFPAIVPPHGAVYGSSFPLLDDQMIEIQKGEKFFYIYGTITYRDVFDDTPIHTTTFCRQVMSLLGNYTRPDKEVTEMFFGIVFPEHNTAD